MIIFLLSMLNWAFVTNKTLKAIFCVVIIVFGEIERKNGDSLKFFVVLGEFISVFILTAFLALLILGISIGFLKI